MAYSTTQYATEALRLIGEAMNDVSNNIYYGSRPRTVKEQMKNFLLIAAPVRWSDRGPWQQTTIRFQCFSREKEDGILPLAQVGVMTEKVLKKFPIVIGRYKLTEPVLIKDCSSDGLGFGYCTIHSKLIVNTTDNYNK